MADPEYGILGFGDTLKRRDRERREAKARQEARETPLPMEGSFDDPVVIPAGPLLPDGRFISGGPLRPREMAVREALEVLVNEPTFTMDAATVEVVNNPRTRMTRNGEIAMIASKPSPRARSAFTAGFIPFGEESPRTRKKARNTKYRRAYKAAFRKIKPSLMTKSGKWKKGGFKKAVRYAHSVARRQTKK